jgi:hypothetical protein
MEYKIKSSTFWKNLKKIYNRGLDWHLADKKIQAISKEKLGLKYLDTVYDDDISSPYSSEFLFEIVDQDKLLWAKLKYGI